MIIRIALCDDKVLQVELTRKLILSTGLANDIIFIETYNGTDLLTKIQGKKLDLIILDIEMDGLSGLKVAERIRENDKDILIVFITGYKEYALNAYDLNVFSYIIKPISREKIFKLMKSVIKHIKKVQAYKESNNYISFKNKGELYQVNYHEIYYFEKKLRKISVCCKDNNFEFYGSIKGLKEQLDDGCFIQVHQGILVNKRMITGFKDGELILRGVENALPVSRKHKNIVINALTENLFLNG